MLLAPPPLLVLALGPRGAVRSPGTSKARGLASCVAADDPTLLPPCLALPSYRQEAGASDLRGPCVLQAALEAAGKLLPCRGGARLGPSSLLLVTALGKSGKLSWGLVGVFRGELAGGFRDRSWREAVWAEPPASRPGGSRGRRAVPRHCEVRGRSWPGGLCGWGCWLPC